MFIKLAFVFLVVDAAVCTFSVKDIRVINEEWNLFKIQYEKKYESIFEEKSRFEIFKMKRYLIAKHNKMYTEGRVSYEMGLNHLADKLPHEIIKAIPGLNRDLEQAMSEIELLNFTLNGDIRIPKNWDWRSKGAVTDVKDQGNCTSSWAFAATGALEGQQVIHKRTYVSLSTQNLIDCSMENAECHGGWPIKAFEYIKRNNGIDTESAYPYEAKFNQCRYRKNRVGAQIQQIYKLKKGNEETLMEFVFKNGPVAVAININDHGFHSYKTGVYDNSHCSKIPNHSVLIVGYGTEKNRDYWLVKNSWGFHWGIGGYIKIARNKNMCGIADWGVFSLVK